jgi:hypothetical protein
MTKISYAIVLFLIILLNVSFARADIPEIVLKEKRAVVTIYINDKDGKQVATGTGFIIAPSGIIATNYHVVSTLLEAGNTLLIKMENGAYFPLDALIDFDEENDVAIFKVAGKELPVLKLSKDYQPRQGESIVVVGSPLGLETTISDGIISSIREENGLIQITAPVSPGSSGSPVFNTKGEVIGIATFLIEGGQNLNFAIPAKYVAALVKRVSLPKKNIGGKALSEARAPAPAPAPEPVDNNIEKADSLFAGGKFEQAENEYIPIWLRLLVINKNHPKLPYIVLQIAKCFIATGDDMTAWKWLKFLNKNYSNSFEALDAKNIISSKRWFYVGASEHLWFIDVSSITSVDTNIVRAFVKYQGTKGQSYTVINAMFDCALGRWTAVGFTEFANDKSTNSYDYSDKLGWGSIMPNSASEIMWKVACDKE